MKNGNSLLTYRNVRSIYSDAITLRVKIKYDIVNYGYETSQSCFLVVFLHQYA